MAEYFTAGNGGIWIQPDGPGTDLVFLGCHQIDAVDAPQGDESPFYCPNPAKPKEFIAVGSSASPPEMITFSIMERVTNVLSSLRELVCPFPVYITETSCGRRDIFENADIVWIYNARRVTNRSMANPVMLDSDDPITRTYDISALPPELETRKIAAVAVASGTVEELNDISFCGDPTCAGSCGAATALGQNGFIVSSEV